MRVYAGHNGYVIALCDCCPDTTEFIGRQRAEEKVAAKWLLGWQMTRRLPVRR